MPSLETGFCQAHRFGLKFIHGREHLFTPVFLEYMVFNSSVWINCIIGILLNLLIFAGPVTIGAIFSIGALAQYIAFSIPVALRVIFVPQHFRSGPWNLGRFSRQCGFIALAWVLLIIPVLCFPAVRGSDLTLSMMNWTSLVYSGTMLIVLIWYAIDARNWFK